MNKHIDMNKHSGMSERSGMDEQVNVSSRVAAAIAALRAGRPVVVLDDAGRENEADVILAAETATPEWIAWAVRHSSGVLCVPLPEGRADELDLPLMVPHSEDPYETAYTLSVDAASGITTGISASDRLRTIRVLSNPNSTARDLRRPGHVFPLRAREGGVLTRRGHTEAAVDLCELAGLEPVGVISELVHGHGPVLRAAAAEKLATEYDLPLLTIEELVQFLLPRRRGMGGTAASESTGIRSIAQTTLPTGHGEFTAFAYRDARADVDHLALVHPGTHPEKHPVVRVHSECLTGDVFGSQRCDCGQQLDLALDQISHRGGALIYLRGHEGRGIGLGRKIAAYALQDRGLDTVEANIELGVPVDARDFSAAGQILADLSLKTITLLTNNPRKVEQLRGQGINVARREALYVGARVENERYLRTKADRLGHNYDSDAADAMPSM